MFLVLLIVETLSAANQKPLVNKDLCARKSVKTNFEKGESQRLASAGQLEVSGSFSWESNSTRMTSLPRCEQRLGKPAFLHETTTLLTSNLYAG